MLFMVEVKVGSKLGCLVNVTKTVLACVTYKDINSENKTKPEKQNQQNQVSLLSAHHLLGTGLGI